MGRAISAEIGQSAMQRRLTPPSAGRITSPRSISSTTGWCRTQRKRAALAEYEPATGDYTLYTSTQLPHVARVLIGVLMLGIPERKLRVVAPDVGGGFGSKQIVYAEEALMTWAACLRAPMSASIPRATSPSSPARIITGRAMRRCLPNSSATCSACRAVLSRLSMAIPRAAPLVLALMVRARPRSAAPPLPRRSARSSTRAEGSPAICSRPVSRTSNSPQASSPSAAPTAA
jgi:hypothetical protein